MRTLVLGSNGQLASCLAELGLPDLQRAGRDRCDITDLAQVRALLADIRPDVVINTAAYTAVDKAESDIEAARWLNRDGAAHAAQAAAERGVPLIHVSTDYVFPGTGSRPLREDDETGPTGIYGLTKLEGERAVLAHSPRHLVVRTAWVYSHRGANFLKTMLRLAQTRPVLSVVADQYGSPTHAEHLARGLMDIARQITDAGSDCKGGIYHLAGHGETNWATFAREIFAVSRDLGGPFAEVSNIPTEAYPTPARRPANSRLDCSKAQAVFGVTLPPWREGVRQAVQRLSGMA